MREPLVSVLLPAHDAGPLLRQAIESALAQAYPHLEIVVVNDGSTSPETREAALGFGDRITYLEQANTGVAGALRAAFEASSGGLVALLDQDDRWLPGKLELQVRALAAHPSAVLSHGSYWTIDGDGARTRRVDLAEREWRPLPSLLLDVPIASATCVMRRDAVAAAGGFDPALPGTDDWDLWVRLALGGGTFVCSAEPLAEYREHDANLSRDLDTMIGSTFGTLDKLYARSGLPEPVLAARARAYARRHAWAAAGLYARGRLDEAAVHVAQAARLRRESVVSARFLGSLAGASGDVRAAAGFLERALEPAQRRGLRSAAMLARARYGRVGRALLS